MDGCAASRDVITAQSLPRASTESSSDVSIFFGGVGYSIDGDPSSAQFSRCSRWLWTYAVMYFFLGAGAALLVIVVNSYLWVVRNNGQSTEDDRSNGDPNTNMVRVLCYYSYNFSGMCAIALTWWIYRVVAPQGIGISLAWLASMMACFLGAEIFLLFDLLQINDLATYVYTPFPMVEYAMLVALIVFLAPRSIGHPENGHMLRTPGGLLLLGIMLESSFVFVDNVLLWIYQIDYDIHFPGHWTVLDSVERSVYLSFRFVCAQRIWSKLNYPTSDLSRQQHVPLNVP